MYKQIQILPLKDGKQVIYSGITLAGKYIPDPPDSRTYELPAGVYDLVPSKLENNIKTMDTLKKYRVAAEDKAKKVVDSIIKQKEENEDYAFKKLKSSCKKN